MPKFWLTETRTITLRTLIEAPTVQAVHTYHLTKDTDWTSTGVREATKHDVISAENNQRYAHVTPDVQINADGVELDEDDPAYQQYLKDFPIGDPRD